MEINIRKVSILINVFFSLVFIIHVGFIGYKTLHPEVPEIVVYKKDLKEIDFPIVFRICAYESINGSERYRRFGYASEYNFFQGKSRFNSSVYGWNGHFENGSTLASAEGGIFND